MKTLAYYIDLYGMSGWKTDVGGIKAPLVMMLRDEISSPGSTVLSPLDRAGLVIAFKTLQNLATDERALANVNLPFTSLRLDGSEVGILEPGDDPTQIPKIMDAAYKAKGAILFVHGEKDNPFTQHTDRINTDGTVTKDMWVGTDLVALEQYYKGAISTSVFGDNIIAESTVITSKAIFTKMLELVLQFGIDTPENVKKILGDYIYAPGAADTAIANEVKLPVVDELNDPVADQLFKGYIAYFGRPADPGGLEFWVNSINRTGGDVTEMVENFGASIEYKNLYAASSSEVIVNSLYQHLFNRNAEASGLNFWADHLDAGNLTLSNIAFTIVNAAQLSDATIVSEKVAAAREFTASLDTAREIALYSNDTSALNARKWLSTVTDDHSNNVKVVGIAQDVINHLQTGIDGILAGNGLHSVVY